MRTQFQAETVATYGAAVIGVLIFAWSTNKAHSDPADFRSVAAPVCKTLALRPMPITQCVSGAAEADLPGEVMRR